MKRGKRGSGRGGEQPSDPQKPKVNPGLQLPPPGDQALGGSIRSMAPSGRQAPRAREPQANMETDLHCTLTESESDNLLWGIKISCLTQREPA